MARTLTKDTKPRSLSSKWCRFQLQQISRHTVILHRKAQLLPWGTWVWMYRPSKLYPLWHPIKINVSNNLHTFLKHMLFHGHLHVSVLHLNSKETSWGLKRPGGLYIISLCILKESFSLETLCIPQEYCFTQYVWNKMDCNYNKILQIFLWKSYTKDWNGPLRPWAFLVRNSNKMTW